MSDLRRATDFGATRALARRFAIAFGDLPFESYAFFGACTHLPTRAKCASVRPLDIHEYAFGSQSCAFRLVSVRSVRLAAPISVAWVTLVEFVASRVRA